MIPFDLESYARIIGAFRNAGSSVLPLTDALPAVSIERAVLLRHDVDYSLALAVRLAEVNARLEVRGTFFVPVASRLFNPGEVTNRRRLARLLELDQSVGLHVHAPARGTTLADAESAMGADAALLARWLDGAMAPVMSWHDPTALAPECRSWLEIERPAGLLNASCLDGRGYRYYGDSNLRHSVEAWMEVARAGHERVQALFHPFNWTLGAQTTMTGILAAVLRHLVEETETSFRENHTYARVLPDGLPAAALDALAAPLRDHPHGASTNSGDSG